MIEGLRLDSLMAGGGSVRISQWLSVLMCLAVPALFAWRALKHAGRRQRIGGGITLLCMAVLTQALPRPAGAFYGDHAAWTLQMLLALPALVMLALRPGACACSRLRTLLPLAALTLEAVLRVMQALSGFSGAEASLILCAAFTLAAIASAVTLYLATPEAETAARPSQL